MRLLYILGDRGIPLGGSRGSAVHARCLLTALAGAGHEVRVLARSLAGPETLPPEVRVLPCAEPAAARRARRALREALQRLGAPSTLPDEIAGLLFASWVAADSAAVLAADPPHAVIERLSLFGGGGAELARRLGVPLLLEVNAPLADEAQRWRALELASLAARIEKTAVAGADAVIAVSEPLCRWAAARGAEPRRIHLVENGVDSLHFTPGGPVAAIRAECGIGHAFLVGFAGSLKPWHGVEILLEALALSARQGLEAHLLLIGEGPEEPALHRTASRLGIAGRVHFTGRRAHAEVAPLLRACDALVAPYPPIDGFYFSPLKVLEYLALGRPVVASAVGPIPAWLGQGERGLLVPPGDAAALATSLVRLSRRPDLARRLAERAPLAVAGRSWADVAARVAAIAESCASPARPHLARAARAGGTR
jgi:glycosyltransferase involved in cell wall biosynthesis